MARQKAGGSIIGGVNLAKAYRYSSALVNALANENSGISVIEKSEQ